MSNKIEVVVLNCAYTPNMHTLALALPGPYAERISKRLTAMGT